MKIDIRPGDACIALDRSRQVSTPADAVSLLPLDRHVALGNTWSRDVLRYSWEMIGRRLDDPESGSTTIPCGYDLQQWVTLCKGAHAYD